MGDMGRIPDDDEAPEPTAPTFGAWLKLRRIALDLTQQELADQAGCSVVTIRKMESDERKPSKQLAKLLSTCLNIPEAERSAFIAFARNEGPQPKHLALDASPWKLAMSQEALQPSHLSLDVSPWKPTTQAVQSQPVRLPRPPTSFVGRQVELDAVQTQLANPDCQLLTLLGPGGIGKTRLAIEVATTLTGRYEQGVFFVPLVGLDTTQHMVPRIAESIRFPFSGQTEPKAQLFNYLRAKQMLLVLDNFEHLLTSPVNGSTGGTDLVTELLSAAPEVKLLVTSRERLLLQREWTYDVGGMRYPQPPLHSTAVQEKTWDGVETYSAVQLFVDCARRVQADFVLDPSTVSNVLRICQAVEGLPLGIELAAAWVRTLKIADIAAELERDLALLDTSLRDVEPRHRNLQVVFDHSWRLLSQDEQDVLKQLAVFQGGFTREAASAVGQATLPLLASLIDKSLLKQNRETGRYELHELIRQVSLEKLCEDRDAEEAARDRHMHFYATFLQAREAELYTLRDTEALAAIELDMDNVRTAWHRAVTQQQTDVLLLSVKALEIFYDTRGWYHEGVETVSQAVTVVRALADQGQLLGKLLTAQGRMAIHLNRPETTKALLEESLTYLRRAGSQTDLACVYYHLGDAAMNRREVVTAKQYFFDALTTYEANRGQAAIGLFYHGMAWANFVLEEHEEALGYLRKALRVLQKEGPARILGWIYEAFGRLAHRRGDYQEARQYFEQGVIICQRTGYQLTLEGLLHELGCVMGDLGAYEVAMMHLQEGLSIAQTLDSPRAQTRHLAWLAYLAILQDKLSEAETYLQENLRLSHRAGYAALPWEHYYVQGELALARKHYPQASTHFQKSLALTEAHHQTIEIILALNGLGKVDVAQGAFQEAWQPFKKALKLAWNSPYIPEVLDILVGMATVYVRQEKGEEAIELLELARHHLGSRQATKDRADRLLTELQTKLLDTVVEAALPAGENCKLDQLVVGLLAA
ncbi:helix-turn-helix domain-containing protein [Chloroflexi bacterium TSY]|nr:helix-turn-helix domain-containing protein [Chloroflexi bacterium TSY]